MNIYLIGYRCTGKSAVGKQLANMLNRRFIDADAYLEAAVGIKVTEFVTRFGWPEFRKKEAEFLDKLSKENRLVVATGGGVILDPENIERMKRTGIVIWLEASTDTILNRMEQDPATQGLRPALTEKTLAEEISDTLSERLPLYERAHHIRVYTDNADIDAVCRQIVEKIRGMDAG